MGIQPHKLIYKIWTRFVRVEWSGKRILHLLESKIVKMHFLMQLNPITTLVYSDVWISFIVNTTKFTKHCIQQWLDFTKIQMKYWNESKSCADSFFNLQKRNITNFQYVYLADETEHEMLKYHARLTKDCNFIHQTVASRNQFYLAQNQIFLACNMHLHFCFRLEKSFENLYIP